MAGLLCDVRTNNDAHVPKMIKKKDGSAGQTVVCYLFCRAMGHAYRPAFAAPWATMAASWAKVSLRIRFQVLR